MHETDLVKLQKTLIIFLSLEGFDAIVFEALGLKVFKRPPGPDRVCLTSMFGNDFILNIYAIALKCLFYIMLIFGIFAIFFLPLWWVRGCKTSYDEIEARRRVWQNGESEDEIMSALSVNESKAAILTILSRAYDNRKFNEHVECTICLMPFEQN